MTKETIYYYLDHKSKIVLDKNKKGFFVLNKKESLKLFKKELETNLLELVKHMNRNKG